MMDVTLVVIYDRAMTWAQERAVSAYLTDKWTA
jgi:hypothetical protein